MIATTKVSLKKSFRNQEIHGGHYVGVSHPKLGRSQTFGNQFFRFEIRPKKAPNFTAIIYYSGSFNNLL